MATPENTLLVRHLPSELTSVEKEGLLRHFHAQKVTVMVTSGRMKNTAFATFDSPEAAKKALQRLHQLKVLGSVLVVEFAKSADQKHFPKLSDPPQRPVVGKEKEDKPEELSPPEIQQWKPQQDEVYEKHGIDYPRNPNLHYLYPQPTVSILTNIANALAGCPKFYVQVLHLMNKMNLPAPFGPVTTTPPIPSGDEVIDRPDILEMEEMDVSSTEESEIESEEDDRPKPSQPVMKRPARANPNKVRKRRKLVIPVPQEITAPRPPGVLVISTSEMFEQPQQQQQPKKIQLILPSSVQSDDVEKEGEEKTEGISTRVVPTEPEVEVGGFGKLEPVPQPEEPAEDDAEDELRVDKSKFVSSDQLRRGRISSEEMKTSSVFRNYQAGEPTTRLYIKNLSKQTTEEDLLYIFGRYVDLESEEVKDMWDIRLMKEGRMKGQAFITYPSEKPAKRAVRDVNGYILHGRPMVVQFARSAKPKQPEDAKPLR
ncbi:RNA-binding region-containing protein 3-like [Liolophura sinensis]|uniref:RNA-binding region-containing protein 3-like n=1 Tax=Liolophura sinensis TaxID=3198878 RepID=UPI003159134A